MSTGPTPWNVLSDAITKKIGSMRERAQKAKDQETQTEYKAWEGILNNPASSEEERQSALDHMKKTVPKEAIPILEGYHKVVGAVHKMRKSGKGGGGQPAQGGQPSSGTSPQQGSPTPAPPTSTGSGAGAGPSPGQASELTLPKALSNVAGRTPTQAGKAEGEQTVARDAVVLKAKREAAEETIKAIEAKGLKIPDEVKAEILSQPTGAIPAGVMRPKASANAPKKAPKMVYGPGGQFRGVTDPEDKENDQPGAEYPSKALIPKDRKDLLDMWDAGEAQSKKEQSAEIDKEHRKTAEMVDMLGRRMDDAIKVGDHKAALKVYNDSKKSYQDAVDRDRTMSDNLRDILEAKKAGKENQQAMLSMLANHIGMTSGSQPKMRMSKAQWDEAKDSVSFLQRIEAKWDTEGYLSGVVLTQEQMDQMLELAHEKVDQLKDHVDRIKNDPDYSEALQLGKSAVPASMKGPKGKSNSSGTSTSSKEETEDEKFLQSVK